MFSWMKVVKFKTHEIQKLRILGQFLSFSLNFQVHCLASIELPN